jgi:hypothetical protein
MKPHGTVTSLAGLRTRSAFAMVAVRRRSSTESPRS